MGGDFYLNFDGASKGNPGKAGCGAVLYSPSGDEVSSVSEYLGEKETNNYAEYSGLLSGLKLAISLGIKRLIVRGDSSLVINQMTKMWKLKSENLIELNKECTELTSKFTSISFEYVPRNKNKRADALANSLL